MSKGPARSRLRLRGGRTLFEGRVEIYHEGVWGSICDDEWSLEDAQVVCRELQLGELIIYNFSSTDLLELFLLLKKHIEIYLKYQDRNISRNVRYVPCFACLTFD